MEKKLQTTYLTCYSLLIVQDLWKDHYQILSIIFLKGFVELNVNGYDDKKCETYKIKCKYGNCFFEDENFKDNFIE